MQTHGGSFSNSFSTCIGQQIQMDTLWLRSRQQKFTDIGNSIILQDRSRTAAKFSEKFTPYSLFSLNCKEQQSLKPAHPAKIHRTTKNDIISALQLQLKRVILSAGGVSSSKYVYVYVCVQTGFDIK